MKNRTFIFACAASALIIAFFLVVNLLTSRAHPWFIYPTFAVLWWPLSVYAVQHKGKHILPVGGTLLIAAFFLLVNAVTSPRFPWAMFPIFAAVWWPLAEILFSQKRPMVFAILGSFWACAFFIALNLVTSPDFLWFIYPVFAVLWWPFSLHFARTKRWKLYSAIAAAYIAVFFALVNWQVSPHTLWFIYPAYAAVWWPLSMYFASKKKIRLFSILMSVLTVLLLAVVNLLYSPQTLWFPWTVFYFVWWPLCQCLGAKARTVGFAIIGATAIILYHLAAYLALTPGEHPWYLYIILPALWWPLTMAMKEKARSLGFLIFSMAAFVAGYGALNLLFSPGYFWSVYLIYPAAFAVIGTYFGSRKRYFALSVWGAVITALFFAAVNHLTTPYHIWAIYPIFAVLFWPLSLYFFSKRAGEAA